MRYTSFLSRWRFRGNSLGIDCTRQRRTFRGEDALDGGTALKSPVFGASLLSEAAEVARELDESPRARRRTNFVDIFFLLLFISSGARKSSRRCTILLGAISRGEASSNEPPLRRLIDTSFDGIASRLVPCRLPYRYTYVHAGLPVDFLLRREISFRNSTCRGCTRCVQTGSLPIARLGSWCCFHGGKARSGRGCGHPRRVY